MFDLKSDLNLCNRLDVTSALAVSGNSAGKQGSFVTLDGAVGTAATKGAFLVWSESNRDNTYGWTPDVNDTGKLTVLAGHYIGYTTEFVTTGLVPGDLLVVGADGKLEEAVYDADALVDEKSLAVAICLEAPASHKYVGGSYDSVKIMSI